MVIVENLDLKIKELSEMLHEQSAEGVANFVEAVKPFVVGVNPDGLEHGLNFGAERSDYSGLLYIANPDIAIPKFNLNYLLASKPMKAVIQPKDFFEKYDCLETLHIFHYNLDLKRWQKNSKQIFEDDLWRYEKYKLAGRENVHMPKDMSNYLGRFNSKSQASCIHSTFFETVLIGDSRIIDVVMQFMKVSPENAIRFYNSLGNLKKEDYKIVSYHDMVNKPKELSLARK